MSHNRYESYFSKTRSENGDDGKTQQAPSSLESVIASYTDADIALPDDPEELKKLKRQLDNV